MLLIIFQLVGSVIPVIIFNSVVFPLPLLPYIFKTVDELISNDISLIMDLLFLDRLISFNCISRLFITHLFDICYMNVRQVVI